MTSEHLADNEGKDMQVGKVDTWTFTDSADIGEFMCVKIRKDGTDGWYFDKVLDSIYNLVIPPAFNSSAHIVKHITPIHAYNKKLPIY